MKNVVVTGPESSGTRFVSRWLEAHPDVVARHWSMPSGLQWMRHWATDHDFDAVQPDAVVWVIRDLFTTIDSQLDREMVSCSDEAESNIVLAHLKIINWAVSHGVPIYPLIYDTIVDHPERFGLVFSWLGLWGIPPPEPVINANARRWES